MKRSVIVTVALAASGCGIENNLGRELPEWPVSQVPPIEEVHQTDAVLQVTTPMVDILWMVDNSCSMGNDQEDLIANFPHFIEFFAGSGLDYHIGVTSSDTISKDYRGSDGTLVVQNGVYYLEPDTPNLINMFQQMARLGIGGRYPERGLGGTYLALEEKRDTANIGFYRDDAAIHTIIISDEPDYTENHVITQPEYEDWYSGLKRDNDDRTFSAIIDQSRGDRYADTARHVGGIVWDLRSERWDEVLERLGLQAAGLKREYFLSRLPSPGTIEVAVFTPEGVELSFDEDDDWTYEEGRNSITFIEYVPEALSRVEITYKVLASETGEEEAVLDAET